MADYKEQLQQNNNELSAILETVEGLPEAESGTKIEAWTGTIDTSGGVLGSLAPTLYYMDETLTPIILGNGGVITETITIAANTVLYFSSTIDPVLSNAQNITASSDVDNYKCIVIRPTANNFSVSRA